MTNRVTLIAKVLEAAKIRTYESRGQTFETVSLWVEVKDADRADRFTVEIHCPKAQTVAKAMQADVLAEINGQLRHDRWKDKQTSRWTGKVYIAIEPGVGTLRSKGMAPEPTPQAMAA
ncbi:MAG: hypothetical protein FD124_1186 [Alphaproteobacteria bacterium]|nr:MAG: hypothetical protein FD160_1299 [Caulobacteraceae bacterium]TPW07350.1 MAG: hypothetical protein FD124_1186 [Alphaproteobacteria bacterium]